MKRSEPMARTPMKRQSKKNRIVIVPEWVICKYLVRNRSTGRCEVTLSHEDLMSIEGTAEYKRFWRDQAHETVVVWRCRSRAEDGHHVRKPRNQHNHPKFVLDVCRDCHDWFDAWHGEPCGRLMADPSERAERAPTTWIQRTGKFEARGADELGTKR